MRLRFASWAIVGGLFAAWSDCAGQLPIGLGLRLGVASEASRDAVRGGGGSIESVVSWRFTDRLSAYVMAGDVYLGDHANTPDVWLEANGYTAGVEAMFGTRAGRRPRPWLRAGVGAFAVSAAGGPLEEISASSPYSPALQLGGGVDIALTPRWHLSPGVGVVNFSPDWEFSSFFTSGHVGTVRYFTLDVGLSYWFGVRRASETP